MAGRRAPDAATTTPPTPVRPGRCAHEFDGHTGPDAFAEDPGHRVGDPVTSLATISSASGRSKAASLTPKVRRHAARLRGGYDQGVAPVKSLVRVEFTEDTMAELVVIMPSSRFSFSDALEKFSEPTYAVAPSATIALAWM